MMSLLLFALSSIIDKDVDVVNKHTFFLPNVITKDTRAEFPKVNMFVSTDKGRSWQLHDSYPSDIENFRYASGKDGVYWFALQFVRKDGTVSPEQKDLVVDRKVRVDTSSEKDVYVIDSLAIEIPTHHTKAEIAEFPKLNLFVSTDRGATWHLYETYKTETEHLDFESDSDGLFWFAVQLVRKDGTVSPETKKLTPSLKVRIDTSSR